MKNYNDIICPICHEDRFQRKATCKDYFVSGERFDICECQNCKFLITANIPQPKDIGNYYKSDTYISHSNTNKGLINKTYHAVRSYMISKKIKLVKKSSGLETGSLLDVGAGIGLFAKEISEKNWNVEGIEMSSDAREAAKNTFNIYLHDTSYWSEIPDQSKDVITLWHVLEHIPNLNEIWGEFDRVLKNSGTLIIAVPNPNSYDAAVYKDEWAAYDVPRHLWHFTPKTLEKLANKHKFQLIKKHPMPFDGFYISMISEKNQGSSLAVVKGFWAGLKGYASSLTNSDRSSSIIYVFKKNQSVGR